MTTYTDEVNIYNPDAISGAIDDAGNAYKAYITEVTSDGIMVAAAGKGTSNGSIVSTTTGWHLSDVLEWVRNGISRFWIGLKNPNEDTTPTVRIGREYDAANREGRMELDYHSLQLFDRDNAVYFHVSDLRDGIGRITESWDANGTTRSFVLTSASTISSYQVYVDDVEVTSGVTKDPLQFTFNTAPPSGSTVKAYYPPSDDMKAYSFAKRGTGRVGGCSVAEGRLPVASGLYSHSEGDGTTASAPGAHSEGRSSRASGIYSHAEGSGTRASGLSSHAQNTGTVAASTSQTALGKWNESDANNTYAVIVGNGDNDTARSNALAIDWDGAVDMWNPHIDMTTVPSSSVYDRAVEVFDKNGDPVGWLQVSQDTSGLHSVCIGASNSDDSAQNQLQMGYDANDNPTAWASEPTVLRKALGALAAGDFAVEEVSTHSSVSIGAGSNSYKNGTKSKSGYYPLGIVSTYTSDFRCPIAYANLTSQASGSAGWAVNIGNWSSSSRTVNANIKILWVKE